MKSILKKLIINKYNAKLFLKPLLIFDQYLYFIIGQYASLYYGGKHPKHDIINYADWFNSNIEKNWIVVDVGSNKGEMSIKLTQKAKKVFGIEIDKKLYQESILKSNDKIEFINCDATKFDYSKIPKVDCITLSNVLEHIENRVFFLDSLRKNVNFKNKPLFLIRVPMIDRHWLVLLKKNLGLDYRLDDTHFIEYTKESFLNEINQANLRVSKFDVRWGEIYAVVE